MARPGTVKIVRPSNDPMQEEFKRGWITGRAVLIANAVAKVGEREGAHLAAWLEDLLEEANHN